jgi:3-oxoacyl-[acyl-carrier-protein] synthase II
MPRILITRTGLITAAGAGVDPVLAAMTAGRSHIPTETAPGQRRMPWPTVVLDPADTPWPPGKLWDNAKKYANTAAFGAVAAAVRAMAGAEPVQGATAIASGVVMAVGCSGSDELNEAMAKIAVSAQTDPRPLPKLLYDEVPDFSYIRGIPSQIGQFVAIATGFRGSNVAVYGEGGAAGLGALAQASRLLRSGELDRVMVVGVAPPLSTTMLVAYDREDPFGTAAVPGAGPFDSGRAGTFPGQAAVALLLERDDATPVFGADASPVELVSCETRCAPSRPDAISASAGAALSRHGVVPDVWWAHGSGSVELDAEECAALGPLAAGAHVTSSKGTLGNAFECGGLIDVALAAESLRRGQTPPVGLLVKPDPELGDLEFVVGGPRVAASARTALVTSVSHGVKASTAGAAVLWGGAL